jgi:hypothetical protein
MVLPFQSYFEKEKLLAELWSNCLLQDLTLAGKTTSCKPYDISRFGFPWSVFALCIFYSLLLLFFIRRIVAVPLARLCLTIGERNAPLTARVESIKAREFRQRKFVGSVVEFFFYTSSFIVGAILLRHQPWSWPSSEWWAEAPVMKVEAHLLIFALSYAARYCASLFSLLFLEHKKKDFLEMSLHHIVTITLICIAVNAGYIRIGLVIMVLFDAADPLLHLAKLFNYVKQAAGNKGPSFSFTWIFGQITDLILAGFAIVFTITRIFMYSYIVYSCSYESYISMFCNNDDCSLLDGISNATLSHHVCVFLVWILNFLQWYWFKLLLVVIYRSVIHGETDDARSDMSQDEDGDTKGNISKTKISNAASEKFTPRGVDDDDSRKETKKIK